MPRPISRPKTGSDAGWNSGRRFLRLVRRGGADAAAVKSSKQILRLSVPACIEARRRQAQFSIASLISMLHRESTL